MRSKHDILRPQATECSYKRINYISLKVKEMSNDAFLERLFLFTKWCYNNTSHISQLTQKLQLSVPASTWSCGLLFSLCFALILASSRILVTIG